MRKKTDNVEESDDDDTTDMQIQQIKDKQKKRNQEIHKLRNQRNERKRSMVEHSDAMKKQKRQVNVTQLYVMRKRTKWL